MRIVEHENTTIEYVVDEMDWQAIIVGACVAHWLSRHSLVRKVMGKSLTHNCLWRFGVKFRHSIRAVSGAPPSSPSWGLKEALQKLSKCMNEMNERFPIDNKEVNN